jgi:hypothetical protein
MANGNKALARLNKIKAERMFSTHWADLVTKNFTSELKKIVDLLNKEGCWYGKLKAAKTEENEKDINNLGNLVRENYKTTNENFEKVFNKIDGIKNLIINTLKWILTILIGGGLLTWILKTFNII